MAPFDKSYTCMSSYLYVIVSIAPSCTIFELLNIVEHRDLERSEVTQALWK